jgi:hypothetical protein
MYETGQFVDLTLFSYTFGKLGHVVIAWVFMFTFTMMGYFWRYSIYLKRLGGEPLRLGLYAAYLLTMVLFAALFTLGYKLPTCILTNSSH